MKPTARELLETVGLEHTPSGCLVGASEELVGHLYCDKCERPSPCSARTLAARVERVLALHSRSGGGDQPICFSCDEAWPCWTIRILDGEEDK
jgi:hypothetical protein